MSRERAKGTRGENYFADMLKPIFPQIERAPLKGVNDAGDYVNVPFPVESKNTRKPLFLEWVRRLRRKAPAYRWVLLWKGDMRTVDGRPLMVVDAEFGMDLLHAYCGPFGHRVRTMNEVHYPVYEENPTSITPQITEEGAA